MEVIWGRGSSSMLLSNRQRTKLGNEINRRHSVWSSEYSINVIIDFSMTIINYHQNQSVHAQLTVRVCTCVCVWGGVAWATVTAWTHVFELQYIFSTSTSLKSTKSWPATHQNCIQKLQYLSWLVCFSLVLYQTCTDINIIAQTDVSPNGGWQCRQ